MKTGIATNADNLMRKVYSYVVEHDQGFAPNPFHKVCSVANCKPITRRVAQVGDILLGFGGAKRHFSDRLVFWMKVDEIITFDEYWIDPRFEAKKPRLGGSSMQFFGDNIYHTDEATGGIIQENSFHSERDGSLSKANLNTDTGITNKVLLGRDYAYFGRKARLLPEHLACFIKRGRNHGVVTCGDKIAALEKWFEENPERGILGRPIEWRPRSKPLA